MLTAVLNGELQGQRVGRGSRDDTGGVRLLLYPRLGLVRPCVPR